MSFERPVLEKKEFIPSAECINNAKNSLEDFLKPENGEDFLLIKDKKTNIKTATILEKAIKSLGNNYREIILDEKTDKKTIKGLLEKCKIVIDLAIDSCEATKDLLDKDIQESGSRAVALYDIGPEVFEKDGALTESLEDINRRLNKMEAVLNNSRGFKIKSSYGTDLEIGLRSFGDRTWHKSNGVINKPGQWDNLPGGEIFTTPDERSVNGRLVLPVLESTISKDQGVDDFVVLNIKNGIISSIQGGESAEKLRKKLYSDSISQAEELTEEIEGINKNKKINQKDIKKENIAAWQTYQCAEIGFGANSKARGSVSNPDGSYRSKINSIVETEKMLGTIHIAFGDTKHGEKEADGFIAATSHYDFVIPKSGLSVEMFEDEDDFRKKRNGRALISDGGLNFGF